MTTVKGTSSMDPNYCVNWVFSAIEQITTFEELMPLAKELFSLEEAKIVLANHCKQLNKESLNKRTRLTYYKFACIDDILPSDIISHIFEYVESTQYNQLFVLSKSIQSTMIHHHSLFNKVLCFFCFAVLLFTIDLALYCLFIGKMVSV